MKKQTSKILFLLGLLAITLMLIVPIKDFNELKYVKGSISQVKIKGNGVGAFVLVFRKESEDLIWLNLLSIKREELNLLGKGKTIEAWYTTTCCFSHNSNEVWQVKIDDRSIRKYADARNGAVIDRNVLFGIAFIFFVASFFTYWKKRL